MSNDKYKINSYLTDKGMVDVLKNLVKLMAEKRPRVPFMSIDQCAALYMGYYLKSLNKKSGNRQKYLDAMAKMTAIEKSTNDFLAELKHYYGTDPRSLPPRLRQKFEEFVEFENLPVEKKVYIPIVPGKRLGYDNLDPPFPDDSQETNHKRVQKLMAKVQNFELREKLDAFSSFSRKKKSADEAAARVMQEAIDAADQAQKMNRKSRLRLTRKSLSR